MATNIGPDEAAHMLRRLGFGAAPGDIDNLVSLGFPGAVDYMLNYANIDDSTTDSLLKQTYAFDDPTNIANFNANLIRAWWMTKMVFTKRQFQEKMTLFWHNHFATALSKVPAIYMYIQNQTLRQNALTRFDTLALKVAQDPAMLIWLDNITNVAAHPNENFARELQELFTMGINNIATNVTNYNQGDIVQIARAFTGWNFRKRPGGGPYDYDFVLNTGSHDSGQKSIYVGTPDETTGNLNGDDVITVICKRAATPLFLVKKLFEFFVFPLDLTNAADVAIAQRYADVYTANDHSISALVRAIFTSDDFFGARARFGLVKSPVELIVGSIRMLGATYNPGRLTPTVAHDSTLYQRAAIEGMDVMNPPNVAGWHLNGGFVDTAAVLDRFNFANTLVTSRPGNPSTATGAFVTTDQLAGFARPSAKKTVRGLLSTLGPLSLDGPTFRSLKSYLGTADDGITPSDWDPANSGMLDERLRGLMHLVMCLPEYQLN
jgi:uncharacterized protein (DUF1800 family)